MAEKSISFTLYKIFLIGLKYLPFLFGVLSLTFAVLGCFGVVSGFFTAAAHMGFIPALFWILASFVFKCCIWHRLPIYYCWINNIISWIDFRYTIPVNNLIMLLIYSGVALVFILMGMYFKNRYNVKQRINKEQLTSNNR